jgi:hypothetical protein
MPPATSSAATLLPCRLYGIDQSPEAGVAGRLVVLAASRRACSGGECGGGDGDGDTLTPGWCLEGAATEGADSAGEGRGHDAMDSLERGVVAPLLLHSALASKAGAIPLALCCFGSAAHMVGRTGGFRLAAHARLAAVARSASVPPERARARASNRRVRICHLIKPTLAASEWVCAVRVRSCCRCAVCVQCLFGVRLRRRRGCAR